LIEGLRTDSLMIGSTGIRVSQILALILAVFGTAFIIYKRKKITK
jgi:phosphatidylglycerol:prolipoprotein diacylglycerol transferase